MAGNWQQRFLRVPRELARKIEGLARDEFVLYSTRLVAREEIDRGEWSHLGIAIDDGGRIAVPTSWLPAESAGRAAIANRDGLEIVRTDLPKETRYHSVESPNWGDASTYGTHTHDLPHQRFPRDFVSPAGTHILMRVLEDVDDGVVVVFEIDAVFDRAAPPPLSPLVPSAILMAMNLLQESTGGVRLRATDEGMQHYLHTVAVDWEILPLGERDDVIRRVLARLQPTPPERLVLEERLDFLLALGPRNLVTGQSGFARYVGAQFADDLVVFENVRYGNALYVMYEDWRTVSQRSRLELLAGSTDSFDRVVHNTGWEARATKLISDAR